MSDTAKAINRVRAAALQAQANASGRKRRVTIGPELARAMLETSTLAGLWLTYATSTAPDKGAGHAE